MTADRAHTREDLINLKTLHSSLVCIDSDGCVFDTMEIKQKKCFHLLIISHWRLETIEKYVREAAEFVNLYSKWRGQNRFLALLKMMDLLLERREVRESGVEVPRLPALRKLADSGAPLGHPSLEKAVEKSGDEELASVLEWSKAVNELIAKTVKNVSPFKWVRESLEKIKADSDIICVSQTSCETLVREWREHDIEKYASVIAGQELGTKTEHISLATKGKYEPDRILMIGDAPGDMKAAMANDALFYPINPEGEEASWDRFYREAYDRFLAGEYRGEYQEKIITEFEILLPDTPSWGGKG